jgi:Protein kinase domain
MLSGRPAFPTLGAVAFGTAVATATHVAPAGHPLQPDPLLTVPVAVVGSVTGWVLIQVTNWLVIAGLTSLLVAGSVLSASLTSDDGLLGALGLTPVLALAALAWLPRRDDDRRRAPWRPARTADADVLGGRWALAAGPLPGSDPGGFSLVRLAEDLRRPGRLVVAKLPDPAAPEQARARLAREQEMLGRCHSRWIVEPVEAGVDQRTGLLYLVMEWYPHGSLNRCLDRTDRFPLGWALDVAEAVLGALVHLQDEQPQPIVHRDVNPRNVLLTGTSAVAVLSDFGNARYLRGADDDTITLAVPYSAWYAAPELVHMRRSWGPASDVYGVAAVVYELVTGLPPYVRESQATGAGFPELATGRTPPMSVAAVNPRLPDALIELLDHCLAAEPDQRPQRAAEVRRRLRATRSGAGDAAVVPFARLRAPAA